MPDRPDVSPTERGRRQAEATPPWSEAKWKRVCAAIGRYEAARDDPEWEAHRLAGGLG